MQRMMDSKRFCPCTKMLSPARIRAGVLQCAECDNSVVDRIEVVIRPLLLPLVAHEPSAMDNTLFGNGCDVVKRRRPDFLWLGLDRAILLEIDENGGHSTNNYSPECDLGWVMDMVAALNDLFKANGYNGGKVPFVVVLRFNPDECDTQRVSLDDRVAVVAKRINHYLKMDITPEDAMVPWIEYHFYHTKCYPHIQYAEAKQDAVRVVRW